MTNRYGWIGDETPRPRAGDYDYMPSEYQLAARAREKLRLEVALLAQEKRIQDVYTKACQIDASGKNAKPMWRKYTDLVEAHMWSKRRYFAGTLEEAQAVIEREKRCKESNRAPYPVFETG